MGKVQKTRGYIYKEATMRSSVFILSLLLAVTCVSCGARRDCPNCCGSLGPGHNPCSCDEVVVKAAKLPRPMHYASPEAITEAAARREAMSSAIHVPPPSYQTGCVGAKSPIYTSTSSIDVSHNFGRTGLLTADSSSTGSCGCGCKRQLGMRDLLSLGSNSRIAPRFRPIGDLCSPSSASIKDTDQAVARVTPAYPGKVRCLLPSHRQVDCGSVFNSVTGGTSVNEFPAPSRLTGYSGSNAALTYGVSNAALGSTGLGGTVGYGVSNGVLESGRYNAATGYGGSSAVVGSSGSYVSGGYGGSSDAYGYNTFSGSHGYGGASGSYGYSGFNRPYGSGGSSLAYGISAPSSLNAEFTGSSSAAAAASYSTSSFAQTTFGGSSSSQLYPPSGCDSNPDIVVAERIAPHQPADPVSLSLAYMQKLPLQKKRTAAEDKLAFGHRMIPQESTVEKSGRSIAEEKLVTVDKPVMQLRKINVATASSPETENIEEDEQLAELDAFERERLSTSTTNQQTQTNPTSHVTYAELGYTPVERVSSIPRSRIVTSVPPAPAIAAGEVSCGPMGPPKPDYIPGNVIMEEPATPEEPEANSNRIVAGCDDEDDDEGLPLTSLGSLAKLNTIMNKYRTSTRSRDAGCPM